MKTAIPTCSELIRNGGRCPVCGYVYVKRDYLGGRLHYPSQDNGAMHRQHVPEPDPRLAGFPSGDIRVNYSSPSWLHRLVYERARCLKREEEYDFTPWEEDRGIPDDDFEKDVHAFLLLGAPQLIAGVAAFAWTLWENAEPSWCLNFVWIAGTWRRRGVLASRCGVRRWRLLYASTERRTRCKLIGSGKTTTVSYARGAKIPVNSQP